MQPTDSTLETASGTAGRLGPRGRLVCASALMLFVELALIRWSGANLLHLSYFSNLVLLASFLGIGLGFLRSAARTDLGVHSPVFLSLFVGFILLFPARIEQTTSELILFTGNVEPTGLPTWLSLPVVFVAVAVAMTSLGEITGRAFRQFGALDAYRFDILGSLLGTVAFAVLSFLRAPSLAWGLIAGAMIVVLYGRRLPLASRVALALLAGLLLFESLVAGVSWSPYYKVQTVQKAGTQQTDIFVNGIPHQAMKPAAEKVKTEPFYLAPYERLGDRPVGDVLIVGAGSGTDIALALSKGATRVDAVEIDPRLAQIGREAHPDRPYSDPRVHLHIGDGRTFLSSTDRTFDLILFALPDSLTLVSGASQLRLESYLFTVESMSAARDRLRPDGVFSMYNYYREPWLVNRLAGTLDSVYGHPPCLDLNAAGQAQAAITIGNSPDTIACAPGTAWDRTTAGDTPPPSVDDRPFLYLKTPHIPAIYLTVLGLVLLASLIGIRAVGGPLRQMRPYTDLFLMGAAFLLLTTKSVTTFALLFGTTWLVNALVFGGVLLAVLLAIETTRRVRPLPTRLLFVLLAGALALAWAVPNSTLLPLSPAGRLLAACALAFTPVFLANLIFAARFSGAANPTAAFAANLFGAMVGGTLEYLSLLTGYRALIPVVGLLYGLAWLSGRRSRQATGPGRADTPSEPAADKTGTAPA